MFYTVKWKSYTTGGVIPPATPDNFFGDGSDGAFNSGANVTYTPSGTDMVVKQFTSFTLNNGHTLTTSAACKGLLIYVSGDCIISGSISMNGRNSGTPTNSLRLYRAVSGGTTQTTASIMDGAGAAAIAAEASQSLNDSTGIARTLAQTGGTGGNGGYSPSIPGQAGSTGTNSGGGGGGGGYYESSGGNGTAGNCFGGGAGGFGEADIDAYNVPGGAGGGNIILVVKGNVGVVGSITANGANGGDGAAPFGGGSGGGGGGNITILHGGTYTNNGTVTASGGQGGLGTAFAANGGAGGAGSIFTSQVKST